MLYKDPQKRKEYQKKYQKEYRLSHKLITKIMKYPRYTREQNLSCKLTNKQIEEIQTLYSSGWTIRNLAKRFEVCYNTIWYWLLTPKERKEYTKRNNESKIKVFKSSPRKMKEWRERKLKVSKQYRTWGLLHSKEYRRLFPEKVKTMGKKWYKRKGKDYAHLYLLSHRDYINQRKRKWYHSRGRAEKYQRYYQEHKNRK